MTIKTSLIITGDADSAKAAVEDLKQSVDQLNTSARGAAAAEGALSAANDGAAASARTGAAAQGAVAVANEATAVSSRGAAVAQGALAVATNAGTASMTAFSASAATAEAVLTGGLSLALTAAIAFLTGFAQEALAGSSALGQQEESARTLVDQIDALATAQAKAIKTQYAMEVAVLAVAEANRQQAIRTIEARKALLEKAIVEQRNQDDPSLAANDEQRRYLEGGIRNADAKVADLQKQLKQAEEALKQKTAKVGEVTRPFTDRGIAAAVDPSAAIGLDYDQKRYRLDRQRDQLGELEYSRQRIALDKQREASLDALSEKEKKTSKGLTDAAAAAAREQKELQADLTGVLARYDPAQKAASDYADELERIARLEKKKKITASDAADYRAQASANYAQASANNLGKAIDLGGINDLAKVETDSDNARVAIDRLVQSIDDEAAAVGKLSPVEREVLGYRKELAALPEGERAAAEARIRNALAEKQAIEDVAQAAEDARRAKEQLAGAAIDAFAAIAIGGQKASDVVKRLAASLASAALEATLLKSGPLAALLNGSVAPEGGGTTASGTPQAAADVVGKSVGKSVESAFDKVFGAKGGLGQTLRNAGLGTISGGIAGSGTGGAIGGALGGYAAKELLSGVLGSAAGPLGAIAGGVLGGVIGGLFKKTQTGAANITSVDSAATISGNNSGFKKAAGGAANSVQEGLASIAEQFGGGVGSFNVTIGQRHGDWRVRSGTGSLKVAKGATEFDDDQAGAIAYAMQLAISQGAITGLSAAVQKAITSSTDLDQALAEALKVQEVETLVGGIGATLRNQFKDLDRQAAERVRIARQYGFDVIAIEKRNAEDRVKLTEQLLEEQVGSLQRLVTEMTSGSLYEGSAVDQRTALLGEIEKAKADLDAGKDGAADTLANLYSQLNSVSKDAFATTGQYAADRSMILDQARAAIAKSNEQILAASTAASDPALTQTNQALDENNDQNAELIALVQNLPAAIRQALLQSGGTSLDLASLARTS